MIILENVTKSYPLTRGKNIVLDNINIELSTDRNLGILGRNGSGKSTLIRLISGAEVPTSGRVLTQCRISWPLAFGGGFQGSLSALDNIRFVSRIYGANWQHVVKKVEDFAELGPYLKMPVKALSSGMRARLNFGLSLAIEFDVYLADEIPGVGDRRFKARFKDAFDKLRSCATLFIVSHDVNTIRNHCDTALLLNAGKLEAFNDVDRALEVYNRP
ncbi:ABC transporter ATP-binding protein [Sneathiella marina]|uniref:ABC transporter ATP-binding protein n=1 Tax=Sneathiella marina TaxID=2950108 RepID=A0ABY4WAL7_9PROT|nr:ABC transporter ATP-binding protein [Sneathiella marina]USG62800.1 ABC transporter ATP-binding protein [Sneathiella marina]